MPLRPTSGGDAPPKPLVSRPSSRVLSVAFYAALDGFFSLFLSLLRKSG